jgi:hypothetical protein
MPVASILARAQRDMRSQRMQRAIRNGTDIPYLPATYVTITSFGLSHIGCELLPHCIQATGSRRGETARLRRSSCPACWCHQYSSTWLCVGTQDNEVGRVAGRACWQTTLAELRHRTRGRKEQDQHLRLATECRHWPPCPMRARRNAARRNADRTLGDRSDASSRNVCGGREGGSSLDVWAIAAQVSSWTLRVI